jgi:dCTP deaminase
MILTGPEIARQVERGNIVIRPFRYEQVNPNSYNYRLGPVLTPLAGFGAAWPGGSVSIPESGFCLQPRAVYLAKTAEVIGSEQFVTSLIGRSSVGRLGLFVQISADLGNLGPAHSWTLEMTVIQPLVVYPGMRIGQVSFWCPSGTIESYRGSYTRHSEPMGCLDKRLTSVQP